MEHFFRKKNMKIRKISTSYLPNILKIVPERYEERKKTGNEQCSVTLYTMYIERICDVIWIINMYICIYMCVCMHIIGTAAVESL